MWAVGWLIDWFSVRVFVCGAHNRIQIHVLHIFGSDCDSDPGPGLRDDDEHRATTPSHTATASQVCKSPSPVTHHLDLWVDLCMLSFTVLPNTLVVTHK